MTKSHYDILFEPQKIGPVTAPNRFYQVPHCTGMGWLRPRMLAELRATKAQGGWGVVCTEWCSVHPSSDDLPYPNASLWDEGDVKSHAFMTEKVHQHGALAGVELWLGGARSQNLFTREVPVGPSSMANAAGFPMQTRAMDKKDIRDVRQWHRQAALRAKKADFDIVYVYATHGYLLSNFLSATTNTRIDEYGGSLENRVRLVRELIEETKDAVGDRCAVAVRFSADQGGGCDGVPVIGEQRDMLELLAELPDLWDINISDYSLEKGASRFVAEAALEAYVGYVKSVTSKPVVTVGRFTSPDTMVAQIRRGVCDFIGAARPSIADPFLPMKIKQGRIEDIRECIGCNICYSGDGTGTPLHCTQNPTISEGWRRGWHPEYINASQSNATVLVVGSGPAGLEATRALGQRGYRVLLSEAKRELGGRIVLESRLPGLSEWIRVRDYRVGQIRRMTNVDVYLDSFMTAQDILSVETDHIVFATGAHWRNDGVGRFNKTSIIGDAVAERVFSPDDIFNRRLPIGSTVIFDDDHYYHASALAEQLAQSGVLVTYVTTENSVSSWSSYTAEQSRVTRRLMECGVKIITAHGISAFDGNQVTLTSVYSQDVRYLETDNLVLVTQRNPCDAIYQQTRSLVDSDQLSIKSLARIGDCDAPSIIATAVFAGHRYARQLDDNPAHVDRVKIDRLYFQA